MGAKTFKMRQGNVIQHRLLPTRLCISSGNL